MNQPVAMTGGTVAHSATVEHCPCAEDRLREPCRLFRGDLKIVAANRVSGCTDHLLASAG
jgi:hypothetical protein